MVDALLGGFGGLAIAYALVQLDGPMDLFLRLRKLVGAGYPPRSPNHPRWPVLAGLLECVYCCATWFAVLLALLAGGDYLDAIAAVGIAYVLNRWMVQ